MMYGKMPVAQSELHKSELLFPRSSPPPKKNLNFLFPLVVEQVEIEKRRLVIVGRLEP